MFGFVLSPGMGLDPARLSLPIAAATVELDDRRVAVAIAVLAGRMPAPEQGPSEWRRERGVVTKE